MTSDLFHVYDTTLRDGAQQEGLNLSVADKLSIARHIDGLGVGFIEGGWPGANPKDTEFFRRAREELDLRHAQLAAFGATRRAGVAAADDPLVAALRDSGAGVVTLVAKSHDRHVELALRTTLEENLAMVRDTVAHLRAEGQRVFLDAEHFFDGYRDNRDYALEVLRTAFEAGADVAALCDTNGGMLPGWVADVVQRRRGEHRRTRRHPLPQRHGLRGREHALCRRRGRDARAGHAQRLRRAHRQRRPRQRRRQPRAQAGQAGAARRAAARGDPGRARRRRRHQLPARVAPAVRRHLGLHAQGGPARERDQGRPEPLPAHGSRGRRQRHAAARLRHGGPRVDRAQGPRARLRARRPSWSAGHRPGEGPRVDAGSPSRRPTRPSSCCCSRRSTARVRRTSRPSRGASSPRPGPATRRRPRRP